jgi:hypothetical protein
VQKMKKVLIEAGEKKENKTLNGCVGGTAPK